MCMFLLVGNASTDTPLFPYSSAFEYADEWTDCCLPRANLIGCPVDSVMRRFGGETVFVFVMLSRLPLARLLPSVYFLRGMPFLTSGSELSLFPFSLKSASFDCRFSLKCFYDCNTKFLSLTVLRGFMN